LEKKSLCQGKNQLASPAGVQKVGKSNRGGDHVLVGPPGCGQRNTGVDFFYREEEGGPQRKKENKNKTTKGEREMSPTKITT